MKTVFKILLALSAMSATVPVVAQNATVKVPNCLQVQAGKKYFIPCTGVVPVDSVTGDALRWTDIFSGAGGGGGGTGTSGPTAPSGEASTEASPVQNTDGSKIATDASMTTAVARLTTLTTKIDALITALGAPMQANGRISNPSFGATQSGAWNMGLSGTLPAFAATPTVNIGTMPTVNVISSLAAGAATESTLSSIKTSLGAPLQAGGSIGNTAFGATQSGTWNVGLAGTLPAFAATPTFNLGTIAGAATSAKQDSLLAALGTPLQANGTVSTVIQATAVDKGATFGTSATVLMAANSARKGYSIQVQSTTASCYINGLATATADFHSLLIGPSGYFEPDHHVGTGAISIICTGASTPVYAREW